MKKAIAIKYVPGSPAPFVVAKGKNELAVKLKAIAEKAGVQLVKMPDLAENLFLLDIGDYIPEDYYKIIAEILVFVQKVKVNKL